MSESATNTRVIKALRGLDPVRVENVACAGTPDINYVGGWIENKYIDRWPVRKGIVRCDHFTPQQRVWHIRRRYAGGKSFVFLQVGRDYLLFKGEDAANHLGKVDEAELKTVALGVWIGMLDEVEFRNLLERN